MEILAWCLGLLAFLVVIMISIGLHEAGHMAVAKLFKLKVPQFFVGFGKTLWSTKSSKTEYGIKAIPLGGFVRIEDPDTPEDQKLERALLSNVAPWKRQLIYAAGPVVNILLGSILLIVMMLSFPTYISGNTVENVTEQSPAMAAGLQSGDEIIAIDGTPTENREDIVYTLAQQPNSPTAVTVVREDTEHVLTVEPVDGALGVTLNAVEHQRGLGESVATMGDFYMMNMMAMSELPAKVPVVLDTLFGAERDPEAPVSMITVGKMYGDTAADMEIPPASKAELFIMYAGILNIGLGIVNLLPFMPLDGGRMLIAFIDSCKMRWSKIRKTEYQPVSESLVSAMVITSGAMVVLFMMLVLVTDIVLITRGEL